MAERTAVMKVSGIHCEGCAGNIDGALKSIKGVKEVKVDISNKRVSVKFDTQSASQDDIKAAIRKAGYGVS